jgi:hypothetical protein
MALDKINVFCVRIQPSNKADADFSVCLLAGQVSLYPYGALKVGYQQWHEVFA